MKNKLILICLYLFLIIITSISCRREKRDEICDTPYKISNIKLTQNIVDSLIENKYDSINFIISTEWDPVGDVWCDPNAIFIDSYKSIVIITLNKYNLTYDTLDTISNNLKIVYLKVDDRGMSDYEYYNSLSELFQVYQSKPIAYGLSMELIEPPDSILQVKLKIIINLWDNREFVLYSKPIIIKP